MIMLSEAIIAIVLMHAKLTGVFSELQLKLYVVRRTGHRLHSCSVKITSLTLFQAYVRHALALAVYFLYCMMYLQNSIHYASY